MDISILPQDLPNVKSDIVYIYGLHEPGSEIIMYVGSTKNLKGRLSGHVSQAKTAGRRKYETESHRRKRQWLMYLEKRLLRAEIKILEHCAESSRLERERYWVLYYQESNPHLLNSRLPPSKNWRK